MTKKQEFRNPLEAVLAKAAGILIKYKTSVIIWAVVIFILAGVAVSWAVFSDIHNRSIYAQYKTMTDEYYKALDDDPSKKIELSKKAVTDFEKLRTKAITGYVKENADYILAGFYFAAEDYKKAGELYRRFYNEKLMSDFRPLAVIQAALCAEEIKDFELAFDIYSLADHDYGKTDLHGQVLYDMGRILLFMNEPARAKEKFQQVMAEAPGTDASEFAKKRLSGI